MTGPAGKMSYLPPEGNCLATQKRLLFPAGLKWEAAGGWVGKCGRQASDSRQPFKDAGQVEVGKGGCLGRAAFRRSQLFLHLKKICPPTLQFPFSSWVVAPLV